MPRDLPTRRDFLSGSHFVSFIPLVLLRVVSNPEVEEVETLYHAVHVPLLSLTCGTSSTCRVWHFFIVRVETLAFIRKKSEVILYHVVSLLLDIRKNTSVHQNVGHRPSWSTCHAHRTPRESHPGRRATVIMTNEPSNHRPNLSHCEVARTKEPS